MNKNLIARICATGFVFGVAFLTLTGCIGYVDRPGTGDVYVAPAVQVEPVFLVEDDYVYYPQYELYYGGRSHRWYNHEGSRWLARPAPRGVSERTLHSAPSVKVDFHDSPVIHHNQVVKSYPKNWKPADSNHGHPEAKQEGHREDKH